MFGHGKWTPFILDVHFFLLIFSICGVGKNVDHRHTPRIPAVNIFSALNLNKFTKNLKIELYVWAMFHGDSSLIVQNGE